MDQGQPDELVSTQRIIGSFSRGLAIVHDFS